MARPTRPWKDVLTDQPVNEMRVRVYERLMAAEERIAHARYRAGVDHEVVVAALDCVDERMSDAERREDRYLSALTYYVEALGGRLEVRAVFGDETILLPGKTDELSGDSTARVRSRAAVPTTTVVESARRLP